MIIPFTCLFSQKEDNVWLVGGNTENTFVLNHQWGTTLIDFSDIDPIFYYDSLVTMDFRGANSSVSDSEGKLQLYTNGMHVHDGNHKDIINGDTLAYSDFWEHWVDKDYFPDGSFWIGGFPIIQAVLLLPIEVDKYCAIYKIGNYDGEVYPKETLNYSIIEKNELGEYKIVEKDILAKESVFDVGKVNACRHANGKDWWVIQQNIEADSLFVFLLDDRGLHLNNTTTLEKRFPTSISLSQVAFSPDGNMYAEASTRYIEEDSLFQEITLYDFDRCEGLVNLVSRDSIEIKRLFSTVAFSPNSEYLYTSTYDTLYQYDLTVVDWKDTKISIAEYDGYYFEYNEFSGKQETRLGPMALGRDGRIYSVPPGNNRYLHTIEYPDEGGEDTEVIQHKIMIPTSNFRTVPNLPNYRLGPLDGSSCDTLGLDNNCMAQFRYIQDSADYLNVRFTDISYFRPESWTWDFGDGTMYDGKKPYYHQYEAPGAYHVCLTVSNENGEDKYCKTIYLGVTATEDNSLSDHNINLFPNPVESQLYIEIRDYFPKDGKMIIYNEMGQKVKSVSVQGGWNHFDVPHLSSGFYFYFIFDDSYQLYSGKFVKL